MVKYIELMTRGACFMQNEKTEKAEVSDEKSLDTTASDTVAVAAELAPAAEAQPKKKRTYTRKKTTDTPKEDSKEEPEKSAEDSAQKKAPRKRTSTKKTAKKAPETEKSTEATELFPTVGDTDEKTETDDISTADSETAESEQITAEPTESDARAEMTEADTEELAPVSEKGEADAVETAEAVSQESETSEEDVPTRDDALMNVEHFSDYRSKSEESESVGASEDEEDVESVDLQSAILAFAESDGESDGEAVEYENLTILDDGLLDGAEDGPAKKTTTEPTKPIDNHWTRTRWDEVKYNPDKPRKVDTRFEFIELFVFTLAVIMLITTFFFRHSIVDGQSMEGTLHDGEHLIISDLFYTPERGDIIVCADYETGLKKPIVKRVIATEGETVRITREGEVYIDGVLLVEDYVYIDEESYRYTPMIYVVPEGEVFVMGDHRNMSTDSRVFGSVKEEAILGRVLLRFLPIEKFGTVK